MDVTLEFCDLAATAILEFLLLLSCLIQVFKNYVSLMRLWPLASVIPFV